MNRWRIDEPPPAAAEGAGQDAAGLPDGVIDAAIGWSVRLQHQPATAAMHRAFERWLQADPLHALAWQRVGALRHSLASLPAQPVQMALQQVNTRRRTDRNRRQALKLLAGGGVILGTGWLVREHAPWQRVLAESSTRIGEQKTLHLADGTEILLNTDSAVNIVMAGDQRLIDLRRGEIRVVTGDDVGVPAKRPFWVQTPVGRLQALGTRFVVRLERDRALVSVQDGAVALYPRDDLPGRPATVILQAGEGRWLAADGVSPLAVRGFEPDAWTEGVIAGHDMRLADLLAEMARYRRGVITCDERVADQRVSGVFHIRDTDAALGFLAEVQRVRVTRYTRWWVVVGPA